AEALVIGVLRDGANNIDLAVSLVLGGAGLAGLEGKDRLHKFTTWQVDSGHGAELWLAKAKTAGGHPRERRRIDHLRGIGHRFSERGSAFRLFGELLSVDQSQLEG